MVHLKSQDELLSQRTGASLAKELNEGFIKHSWNAAAKCKQGGGRGGEGAERQQAMLHEALSPSHSSQSVSYAPSMQVWLAALHRSCLGGSTNDTSKTKLCCLPPSDTFSSIGHHGRGSLSSDTSIAQALRVRVLQTAGDHNVAHKRFVGQHASPQGGHTDVTCTFLPSLEL